MNIADQLDLERAYKDASTKVAALPDRLRDEYQQADAEGRKPIPIQPLTPIRADLVIAILGNIQGDPPKDLEHVITAQKRSCALHGKNEVALSSEQLKALMDAANVGQPSAKPPEQKEEANAPL